MSEEIFIKILDNTATEVEKSSFYQSLEEDGEKRELYYQYKNLYVISDSRIDKYEDIQKESFEHFWSRINPMKTFNIHQLWYRYAAVFVIALSLGLLIQYFNSAPIVIPGISKIEYTSEKGSVSTIHLEDGSAIWLSSGSKITLLKSATGEVTTQLNGEAYFDLIPSQARKFAVDLGYFKVKDIGTKFNIRAYTEEPGVFATLVDGQINLFDKSNTNPFLTMQPGDYLHFDKQSNRIAVTKQDPSIATAWKEGKFVFIDKTLAEICKELENWYNVEIIISNKSLANYKYTSVIKRTTTVNMVMKMLALTDKINYKITDRKEAHDIVYVY